MGILENYFNFIYRLSLKRLLLILFYLFPIDNFEVLPFAIYKGIYAFESANGISNDLESLERVSFYLQERAGITVSAISRSTNESGQTASFTIVLNSQPKDKVKIDLKSSDESEGTIEVKNVTFTEANWNIAQTITVTGVDDDLVDGNVVYRIITGKVDSEDDSYGDLKADDVLDVSVVNEDNDLADFIVTPQTVRTREKGPAVQLSIVLTARPKDDVTLFIDSGDTSEGVVSKDEIKFKKDKWSSPQIVRIEPVDDEDIDGDVTYFITIGIKDSDDDYQDVGIKTVTVINVDDDFDCPAVEAAPTLNPDVPTVFCQAFSQNLDEYNSSPIPSGVDLIWSSSSDFSNTGARLAGSVVNNAASYYGFFYNEGANCNSPPLEVNLVQSKIPQIIGIDPATICGAGTAKLSATVSEGGSVYWYDSANSSQVLAEGSSFTTPYNDQSKDYFVEASANGCVSARVPVRVTVIEESNAGTTANTSACSVAGNGVSSVDLDNTRDGVSTGVWSVVGTPPGAITIGSGNVVDFLGASNGDYVFRFTTSTTNNICPKASVDVAITVSECTLDTDNDGLLDGEETVLGTDINNPDTDGDGISDGVEVGSDVTNSLDEDGDSVIDALESNILDADNDGVVDQQDPANEDSCIPIMTVGCGIDFALEVEVDNSNPIVGEQIKFTIVLYNLTVLEAVDIRINELIDASMGFQYISHRVDSGLYDPAAGVWLLSEVAGEAIHALEIQVRVLQEGFFQNTASLVSSQPEDGNVTNNVASVTVHVGPRSVDACGFVFNQISPNADGINDRLIVNCIQEFSSIFLEIFDRYGNKVYSVRGYDNSWDGRGENGVLPKGTYFYIMDLGDGTEVKKGWIQIMG